MRFTPRPLSNNLAVVTARTAAPIAGRSTADVLRGISVDPEFQAIMTELGPVWHCYVPMVARGRVLGSLLLVRTAWSGRGAFSAEDIAAIRVLGEPAWLLDVSRFHDSFRKEGRRAFPAVRYLVPDGFPDAEKLGAVSLYLVPPEWKGEVEVRRIDGMPSVQEHAVFHVPSRTLIVADVLFNLGESATGWTRFVAKNLMRLPGMMGMSLAFRLMIRDRAAFRESLRDIFSWDFDRVIVGHGEMIPKHGKRRLRAVLDRFGLSDAAF
jgi:hypothetical protein